jgi:hypothetical protein
MKDRSASNKTGDPATIVKVKIATKTKLAVALALYSASLAAAVFVTLIVNNPNLYVRITRWDNKTRTASVIVGNSSYAGASSPGTTFLVIVRAGPKNEREYRRVALVPPLKSGETTSFDAALPVPAGYNDPDIIACPSTIRATVDPQNLIREIYEGSNNIAAYCLNL